MNIAVDIQPLATESAQRGMGVYTLNLLEQLFCLDKESQYYLFNPYGDCCFDNMSLPPNVHYTKLYPGEGCYLLDYAFFPDTDEVGMKYESIIEGLFQTFIHKNKIDIFFITSPFDLYMVYNKKWFEGTRVACIFYDLVPWLFKQQYMQSESVASRYNSVMNFLLQADLLLAISQSAKDDIVTHMNADERRVKVIHAGVASGYSITDFSDAQKKETYKKYAIDSEYMLFPSGDDFRKNALKTVRAYAALPLQTRAVCQLVITGKAPALEMEAITDLCKETGIAERVIFTGHIPYEDLLLLYNNAKLVLFPSLYEGFGLPVIEAFKCGKNVVTSNNSSLGEVAEGAAVLVNPYSAEDIARGVLEALAMNDFSAFDLVKAQRIALYTWENSAATALEALNSLVPLPEANKGRKKIAYFSPLPPMPSKAASYGETILAMLERHCDVDIYVEKNGVTDRYINVMHHELFAARAELYDAVLYQMADDEHCLYMLPYIGATGGTVFMQDAGIHEALLEACKKGVLDWPVYQLFLQEEVSDAKFMTMEAKNNSDFAKALVNEIDMNRVILDAATKIVVRDEALRMRLLEKNSGYCIHVLDVTDDTDELLNFVFGWRKKYLDDADIQYICEHDIPNREIDAAEELPKIAETLCYLMQDGN